MEEKNLDLDDQDEARIIISSERWLNVLETSTKVERWLSVLETSTKVLLFISNQTDHNIEPTTLHERVLRQLFGDGDNIFLWWNLRCDRGVVETNRR